MDLPYLNDQNGASHTALHYCEELTKHNLGKSLIGAELGVAYGGGVQRIGRLWKPHGGTIYGLDTFEGHPKQLAASQGTMESDCMDCWYESNGTNGLSYEYQRKVLDDDGLDNVILVKGLVTDHSLDMVPYLHYALLDLDIVASMVTGWRCVRRKMLSGGYLCLHDVLPIDHITGLYGLYQEIMASDEFDLVAEHPEKLLVVLRRK